MEQKIYNSCYFWRYCCSNRTGEKGDSHGMTTFVIEKGIDGFSSGKKEDKLGMRSSETAELIFDNCKVHESNILGEVGDGFIQSMKVLDGGRISIAHYHWELPKGFINQCVKYSQEREQFGKPIFDNSGNVFLNWQIWQLKLRLQNY